MKIPSEFDGLAIVQGDLKFLARSFAATLRGTVLAIVIGIIIGLLYWEGVATQ